MSSPCPDFRQSRVNRPAGKGGLRKLFPGRLVSSFAALVLLASFTPARTLRVCADPDNLPFSNRAGEGFENHIAKLLAKDLGADLSYEWQRMGRGFVREVLDKSKCDLLIGIPSGFPGVLTTSPYYRSGYVFVTRRDAAWQPSSLDDERLRKGRIAVQALDEEYSPPAVALARRGLQSAIVGFYTVGSGVVPMLQAVADRRIPVAIVWGPLAGFASQNFQGLLLLTPVTPELDSLRLPLTFEIAMGVRKAEVAFRDEVQRFLNHRTGEIDRLLAEYHIPRLPMDRQPKSSPERATSVAGTPAD